MTDRPPGNPDPSAGCPGLPRWAASGRPETPEDMAFRAGAALAVLDALTGDPDHGVPVDLLASRLALAAALAISRLEGRLATPGDLRDAVHLAPPGAARGPDGDLLGFWRDAVRLRPDDTAGMQALAGPSVGVAALLDAGAAEARGPLAGGVAVLRAVLAADARAERAACLLCDAVLARALGWKRVLPLAAPRLTRPALRDLMAETGAAGQGGPARLAILAALGDAIRLCRDLARRSAALRAVAPRLRARGSDAAVALFLAEEAVAPSMLAPVIRGTRTPMTGRAARRLCDRLVALGVARELTGRATFRLYGIAP